MLSVGSWRGLRFHGAFRVSSSNISSSVESLFFFCWIFFLQCSSGGSPWCRSVAKDPRSSVQHSDPRHLQGVEQAGTEWQSACKWLKLLCVTDFRCGWEIFLVLFLLVWGWKVAFVVYTVLCKEGAIDIQVVKINDCAQKVSEHGPFLNIIHIKIKSVQYHCRLARDSDLGLDPGSNLATRSPHSHHFGLSYWRHLLVSSLCLNTDSQIG